MERRWRGEESTPRRAVRFARGGGSRGNCPGITRCASTSVPSASRSLRGLGEFALVGLQAGKQELISLDVFSQRVGDSCGMSLRFCQSSQDLYLRLLLPFLSSLPADSHEREA